MIYNKTIVFSAKTTTVGSMKLFLVSAHWVLLVINAVLYSPCALPKKQTK